MDRKRELKEQYKQMKTVMGTLIVQNKINNKYILVTSQNVKGMMNRIIFQLKSGGHPYSELQKEWNESDEKNFDIRVLEILDYDKDDCKTDYTEELSIMEIVWAEKLSEGGMTLYIKQ